MQAFHTYSAAPACDLANSVRAALAEWDIQAADEGDVVEVREFAARLIGPAIASSEALGRVHGANRAALFAAREFAAREAGRLSGAMAIILLNRAGLAAVLDETFDPIDPDLAHVAAGEAPVAGVYGWGIAALDKPTARRLIGGYLAMAGGATGHLAYFARAATAAGAAMLDRLGFRPHPGSHSGLLARPPLDGGRAAA